MALNLGVLTVQIGADVSQLVQGFQQAGRMVRLLETQFMDMQKTTAQLTTTMNQAATATKVVGTNAQNAAKRIANVGHGSRGAGDEVQTLTQRLTNMSNRIHLMFGGAALTAAFTMPFIAFGKAALNSAIDFESAFAGVRKTVNATELEFATLSKSFREMSQEMPVTAVEFARIGEFAGQLGVRGVRDITKFSEVVAKMAVSTNLSTDQAAVAFARISNIMQLPIQEVDKMGSVIVELGNNFAVFEDEITEFALRIAGAGKQVGLSIDQILAFSAAISSVGIKAEAGGTAIQRIFINLGQSVAKGGAQLQNFAKVAGMSMDTFAQLFRADAASAITEFIEGLKRIQDEGGNVFQVLGDLDVNEQRVLRTLLSTAGAGDLLRRSLDMAADALQKNNALNEEAAKRFGTTASQIQILRNTWDEFLRQTGELAIPMLGDLLGKFKEIVKSMQEWDNETKKAVVGLGALLAVVGPLMLGLSLTGAAISGWQKMLEILGISAAVANKVLLLAGAIFTLTKALKEGVVETKSWLTELDKVRRMGGRFNFEVLIPRPFAAIRPQDFVIDPSKQFTQHDIDAEVERFQRAAETFRRIQKQQSGSAQTTTTAVEQQADALIMLEAALKDLATQTAIYTAQTSGIGTTAETIAKQQEILTTTLLKQEIQVVLLNKRYEDASNSLGEYAEDTLKAKDALDKARVSEAQTAAELESLGRAARQLKFDQVASEARKLENEFAIFQIRTKAIAGTTETLATQQDLLRKQLVSVDRQVAVLTSQYDQANAAMGETAAETLQYESALESARRRQAELRSELQETQRAIDGLLVRDFTFQLQRANNEWNIFAASAKDAADSAQFLERQQRSLESRIKLQGDLVNALELQYNELTQTLGPTADATMKTALAWDNAQLQLAKLNAELDETKTALQLVEPLRQVSQALDDAANSSTNAKNAYENFSAQLEKAESSLRKTIVEIQDLNSVISKSESAIKNAFSAMQAHVDSFEGEIKSSEQAIRDAFTVMEDHVRSFDDRIRDARGSINRAFGDMRDQIADISRQADAARRSINDLLNVPLKGTSAVEQQLFNLAQQERQVNLQANLVRQRLAIAAPGERTGLEATLDALQAQLEQLRLTREEVQLRADIEFEPMRRELNQMVKTVEEMSFEEIKAAIEQQQRSAEQLESNAESAANALEKLEQNAARALGDPKKLGFDEAAALVEEQIKAIDNLTQSQKRAQDVIDQLRDSLRGTIFPFEQSFGQASRAVETNMAKIRELTLAQTNARTTLEQLQKVVSDVVDITKPSFEESAHLVKVHADSIRAAKQRLDEDLLPAFKRQSDAVNFLTFLTETHKELLDKRIEQEKELQQVLQDLKSGALSAAEALSRVSQIKALAVSSTAPKIVTPSEPITPGVVQPILGVPAVPPESAFPSTPPRLQVPIEPFFFHTGGIVPGTPTQDVPAILQGGEMVLTRSQQRGMGTTVTFGRESIVVNGATNPVETAEEIYDRLVRRLRREGIVIN